MDEIEKYRKEKKKAEKKGDIKEAAQFCNLIGELLAKQGKYEEAITEHEQELFFSEAAEDEIGVAVANRKIGECFCEMGQFSKAIKHQRKHLQGAQDQGDDVETQRAFATIGRTYLFQAESTKDVYASKEALKKAKLSFQQSLEFCERLRNKITVREHAEMKARLLLNIGLVYEQKADMKKGSEFMKQAITLSETHSLKEDLFRCQISLASFYQRHSNWSPAIQLFDSAYKYAQSTRDKASQTDILTQKTLIFLQLGDFFAAQRTIKKAYKINATTDNERERIEYIFKAVIFMGQKTEALNALPEQDYEGRMSLYEKLGDTAATINNFKQAIKCYRNMLECAVRLNQTGPDLIPVYVSLAQTYVDDKQYAKAIEYYHKELECRAGDNEQMSRTWLNIADAEEMAGDSYDHVKKSYLTALECAKAASHHKLQAAVLKSMSASQTNFKQDADREETKAMLASLRTDHDLASDDELSDSEGTQDVVPEEEIDLQPYLSDSDATDDEEYDRAKTASGRTARRKRKAALKRNEKGETPLHTACIEGDEKKVKALLAQGHPTNARDHCGWIPLHEAANHGHAHIVELLLDAGAWINDRGGRDCHGISPLHDSCSCGNISVIQLLVSRGANVHAKDNDGQTALDSLLDYVRRSKGLLSGQDVLTLKAVEKLLRDTMKGNNPHLSQNISPSSSSVSMSQADSEDESQLPSFDRRKRRSREARPITSTQMPTTSQLSGRISPTYTVDDDDDLEESVIREYEQNGLSSTPMAMNITHPGSSSNSSQRRNKRSRTALEEDDMDSDPEYHHSTTPRRPNIAEPRAARDIYQNAIASMRRSAVSTHSTQRGPTPRSRASAEGRAQPALLEEDDGYVGDDWLIDDVGEGNKPAKRKRMDVEGGMLTTSGTRRSGEGSGKRRSRGIEDEEEQEDSGITQGTIRRSAENTGKENDSLLQNRLEENLNNSFDPILDDFEDDLMFPDDQDYFVPQTAPIQEPPRSHNPSQTSLTSKTSSWPSQSSNASKKPRQTKLSTFGVTSQTLRGSSQFRAMNNPVPTAIGSSQPPGTLTKPVMKLKVRIKDHLMLVPVPSADLTISWLSEEAAQRYYKLYNLRPLLVIVTKDGATLSPEDPVSFILTDNEEVEGKVQSWDLPPLPDRYTDACSVQKTVMYRNVKTLMSSAVSTHSLSLVDLALRPPQFSPVCKALQCQYVLKELHLKGNRLGDDGVSTLCSVLSTLPSLTTLNLAANQITAVGLRTLASTLEDNSGSADKPLKALEKLSLSYNPLGDGSTQSLSVIVRHLPVLTSLSLAACDLTMRFFQQHRIALADALQASPVDSLDLAHNLLGPTGVELLLRCVRPSTLSSLDLTGVLASYTTNHIHKHLYAYLTQPDCALTKLVLDDCFLLPDLWPEITGFVSKSCTLETLSLSANPKLSNADWVELLEAANQWEQGKLAVLVFNGCNVQGPLSTAFIDAINDKLNHAHPLRHVEFTCTSLTGLDTDTLRDVWLGRWADDGRCSFDNGKVVLSTAEGHHH